MVTDMAVPKAISRDQLVRATKEDPFLIELVKSIQGRAHGKIRCFDKIKDELSVKGDGLVLRGSRIAVPFKFQKRVVQIAHGGHLGVVKTKQLLRNMFYFDSEKNEKGPFPLTQFYIKFSIILAIKTLNSSIYVYIKKWSIFLYTPVISSTSVQIVTSGLNDVFSAFGIPEMAM
ncbi:hypothetical protein BpHYR1_012165 [Brachionus plicatilis]|uniref:Integrase zinc-binding domain-containing protein n=1 Tax=Brachionus plicatilis TaxID=10195 RepID=A0A3M7SCS4_BRAPC|nr:hypothetical protein BpHYR1_012165 [Brachionus plicatilis]